MIDTVRASLAGSEDSSEHVSAYLRVIRRIRRNLPDAGAILAHHAGWQDGEKKRKRERGSSAFGGNVDATLYLEVNEEFPESGSARLILSTRKTRDSEKPPPLYLLRRRVTLSEDDGHGEPQTSCVIDPDPRSKSEREAAEAEAAEADIKSCDLAVLKVIAEQPEMATFQDRIRVVVGRKRDDVIASMARLLQERAIVAPEKQRQPYRLSEIGADMLAEAQ